MRFVLTYFAVGLDGRGADVHFPLEAPSHEFVERKLRDAAEVAAREGSLTFDAFGTRHYTHNFVRSVSAARIQYLRQTARERGQAAPACFVIEGCNYVHLAVTLQGVEAWFEKAVRHREPALA